MVTWVDPGMAVRHIAWVFDKWMVAWLQNASHIKRHIRVNACQAHANKLVDSTVILQWCWPCQDNNQMIARWAGWHQQRSTCRWIPGTCQTATCLAMPDWLASPIG